MAEEPDWAVELKQLLASIEDAAAAVKALDGRTSDRQYDFKDVRLAIEKVRSQGRNLFERLNARPLGLLIDGWLLSREQFYLLASRGLVESSVPVQADKALDPYEVFAMFHYEDPERRCYIGPDEHPLPPGRVKIRWGKPPEEIAWVRLRPEQQTFFERFMPDVARRFKREA